MNKFLLAAAALMASCCAASAQSFGGVGIGLAPLGYCQISSPAVGTKLSTCVIAGVTGIPLGANAISIKTETQAARWRDDGTAPNGSVGMPMLTTDPPLWYEGNLQQFQIIQQSSGAVIDISFYKVP